MSSSARARNGLQTATGRSLGVRGVLTTAANELPAEVLAPF
jgi:hypothetical protein